MALLASLTGRAFPQNWSWNGGALRQQGGAKTPCTWGCWSGICAIEERRKENKDKRAEARLKALELRARGAAAKEVSAATGLHAAYVTQLVAKYRKNGLEAISGNHYGGNHRNMSAEEEASILAPFKARAEKGELVEISEIAKAYQSAVDHPVSRGQIYFVLHRHGWRKVMPRSKHPRKASDEEIAASKKIKPQYKI